VARKALLQALITAWASGKDGAFLTAAQQIIEEERSMGHVLLARELSDALEDPRRPGAMPTLSLRPIPRGRDDRPLLSLAKARVGFSDLVFSPSETDAIEGFVTENEHRTLLTSHALRPRQRLLLVGPSGSGKTSVAHAIADRLSLPLASANLAALTSSYLGETARNIEAVMTFADANPCVLLLDEFDALAGERSRSGDHGELRRVVATVLQAMDEVRGESITVATSNHPGLLDSAIWRRFDEVLALSHPEASERRQLLATKLAPLPTKVNIDRWVKELAGTSAADVERTCLDALRLAVLEGASATEDRHLVQARSRLHARGIAVATVANPSLS
jgi:hypothetical protein